MCVACVQNVIYAEAIFDYQGNDNEELSFHAGDLIEVSDTSHKQWWWGTIKATTLSSKTSQPKSNTTATPCDEIRHGWIPASYVRVSRSIMILNRFVERFLYDFNLFDYYQIISKDYRRFIVDQLKQSLYHAICKS